MVAWSQCSCILHSAVKLWIMISSAGLCWLAWAKFTTSSTNRHAEWINTGSFEGAERRREREGKFSIGEIEIRRGEGGRHNSGCECRVKHMPSEVGVTITTGGGEAICCQRQGNDHLWAWVAGAVKGIGAITKMRRRKNKT